MYFITRLFGRRKSNDKSRTSQLSTASVLENRRYRVDTPYLLPKDLQEVNRLDFQHHALRAVIGTDYVAPIGKDIMAILDVGCGTGRWAIDIANEYPLARVSGIDVEAPIPSTSQPKNCFFYEEDIVKNRLPFENNTFDYVHQRLLVGAIPAVKWPFVLGELARVTRPGGWVELLESGDIYHNIGPAQQQLKYFWDQGILKAGFDLSLMPMLDSMLANAGMATVQMKKIQMPLGKWAGRGGELMAIDIYNVFVSFRGFFVSTLGMPSEAFDQALAALPEEWERLHTTYEFYLVCGQK